MNVELSKRIAMLYEYYDEIIKPMLVNVESKYENHPLTLFNEIRAFNDHIARCYRKNVNNEYRSDQIKKAEIHLDRLLLDLYKFLNVYYYDKVEKFEHQCKNIDLTTINSGEFYIKFRQLRKNAVNTIREAKLFETIDKPNALGKYQDASNILEELDTLIENNMSDVNWARVRFTLNRFGKLILWLIAAIISGIVSVLTGFVPYEKIITILSALFNR